MLLGLGLVILGQILLLHLVLLCLEPGLNFSLDVLGEILLLGLVLPGLVWLLDLGLFFFRLSFCFWDLFS